MKKVITIFLGFIIAVTSVFIIPFSSFGSDDLSNVATSSGDVTYSYDANLKTLIISGIGALEDYDLSNQPWYDYRLDIEQVTINEGITEIGKNAFRQLSAATSFSLPQSLKSVGDYAFFHCAALKSIRFGSNILSIGSFSFAACSNLQNIYFDDMASSVNIGACAFIDCPKMTSAQCPAYTTFGEYSFGFKDEDGNPMSSFTLYGLDYSTAQYYCQNISTINFVNSMCLEYKTRFGHQFSLYDAVDWYSFTPSSSGTYKFYSRGNTDISVELYDNTKTNLLASNDDISPQNLNFDLSYKMDAGKTYYYKVTPYHAKGNYTCFLYPGEITDVTATLPTDFLLQKDVDGEDAMDSNGDFYTYYDMTSHLSSIKISVSYDNGYIDTLSYNPSLEYNAEYFSVSDNQDVIHWQNGTNHLPLEYGKNTYYVNVNVHEHIYTLTSYINPTCTLDGENVYTCSCGKSYSVPIDALGHTEPAYFEKAPTCTEDGCWYYYCSRCNQHLGEVNMLYSLGHNFDVTVTPATLQKDGYTTYVCKRCGYSYVGNFVSAKGKEISGTAYIMEKPDGTYKNKFALAEVQISTKGVYNERSDENGHFSFYVLPGDYELTISSGMGPDRIINVSVSDSNVSVGDVALVCGDFNNDGYVNVRDFAVLDKIFGNGISSDDESYFASYDTNKDGVMNMDDFDFMSSFMACGKIDQSIYN